MSALFGLSSALHTRDDHQFLDPQQLEHIKLAKSCKALISLPHSVQIASFYIYEHNEPLNALILKDLFSNYSKAPNNCSVDIFEVDGLDHSFFVEVCTLD